MRRFPGNRLTVRPEPNFVTLRNEGDWPVSTYVPKSAHRAADRRDENLQRIGNADGNKDKLWAANDWFLSELAKFTRRTGDTTPAARLAANVQEAALALNEMNEELEVNDER